MHVIRLNMPVSIRYMFKERNPVIACKISVAFVHFVDDFPFVFTYSFNLDYPTILLCNSLKNAFSKDLKKRNVISSILNNEGSAIHRRWKGKSFQFFGPRAENAREP